MTPQGHNQQNPDLVENSIVQMTRSLYSVNYQEKKEREERERESIDELGPKEKKNPNQLRLCEPHMKPEANRPTGQRDNGGRGNSNTKWPADDIEGAVDTFRHSNDDVLEAS